MSRLQPFICLQFSLTTVTKMENPDLPQEILLEIFSRIPTKSVGKCRTLSKSWKSHLSANSFIKKHLITRKQTVQQEHLALTTQGDSLCVITSPTEKDEVLHTKGLPNEGCFNVLGSCNGLILVNGHGKMSLLNPITRKQVTIPPQDEITNAPQDEICQDLGYDGVWGFGYDACSDDFKIVDISSYNLSNGACTTVVGVYSVKNGVWKTLDDGCYPFGALFPSKYAYEGGAFVNGALHWLVCSKEGYRKVGYRGCIAVFDLATEVFSEIPLPKEFVRQPGSVVECLSRMGFNMPRANGVSVVGGCLLIVDNLGNGVTEVWMMKEYGVAESWVRFRIQAVDGNWHSIVAMLCFVQDGELLFLTSWDYLFVLDLKNGMLRKVVLAGWDAWFAHGMAFVDSLVSPEGSS